VSARRTPLVLLATLAAACGGDGPAVDAPAGGLRLEAVDVHEDVARLAFRPAGAPAWIGHDRLALADRDAGQVVILDRRAGTRARLGRRGLGPGEMQIPMAVAAREDGAVMVADGGGMRFVEFARDGSPRRTVSAPGRPVAVLAWDDDVLTASWVDGMAPVIGRIRVTDGAVDGAFRPFDTQRVAASAATPLGQPAMLLPAASTPDGGLLLGGGYTYEVFTYDARREPGPVLGRPGLAPEPMSEAERTEVTRAVDQMLRAGGSAVAPYAADVRARVQSMPKPHFGLHGLAVDGEGRLWVTTTHRTGTGTAVDVFSPRGDLLARLDVPGVVRSVRPNLPYVAVLREGVGGANDGVEGIDLYRVKG
jgi:hypothetical protein